MLYDDNIVERQIRCASVCWTRKKFVFQYTTQRHTGTHIIIIITYYCARCECARAYYGHARNRIDLWKIANRTSATTTSINRHRRQSNAHFCRDVRTYKISTIIPSPYNNNNSNITSTMGVLWNQHVRIVVTVAERSNSIWFPIFDCALRRISGPLYYYCVRHTLCYWTHVRPRLIIIKWISLASRLTGATTLRGTYCAARPRTDSYCVRANRTRFPLGIIARTKIIFPPTLFNVRRTKWLRGRT
jgi:hypothetical protein